MDIMVVTLVVLDILDAVVDTRNGLDSMEHYQVGVAEDALDVVAPAISLPDAQVLQPKWSSLCQVGVLSTSQVVVSSSHVSQVVVAVRRRTQSRSHMVVVSIVVVAA